MESTKRVKPDQTAITRKIRQFDAKTGNIYETVSILSKRANQIAQEVQEELSEKLSEFQNPSDNLEEVFENREQIEIARHYEQLPKPTLVAVAEFMSDQIYYRNPVKENSNSNF
ncbi:MAG TPA: RNA polymerase Rpb6 [Bacteroidales bacterium]|nr:MAG: RNA polymerase Rpb6 [Bacteroidetes bacterium GWE2_42_24]OFY29796.1 MAG: RNA polymerase Rpb6 [Bacteroidetes bacterium GWF2_43_11]PKP16058.1 MAG: RNA polymerase Rpb6 [Bacteroidetes bacterium HGW-Bacteroidetes-22]HBZ66393.1 RNA polymerase Rpb6 [Bacteroidales bacterium]